MKALVTGASSGIGREISFLLAEYGYDLIVTSRDKKKLESLYESLPTQVKIYAYDLEKEEDCYKLYEKVKDDNIDILVNNAGFGDCGNFTETSLEKELAMINLNIKAYHILMKLFLKDFTKRDYGRILNVASMAGLMPGPYMATYYATKAYIVNLSLAIQEELNQQKSSVKITTFCPGPVKTNFSNYANVHFKISSLTAKKAAQIAVTGMFKNKMLVIPGNMKINYVLTKIFPIKVVLKANSMVQEHVTKE